MSVKPRRKKMKIEEVLKEEVSNSKLNFYEYCIPIFIHGKYINNNITVG